MVTRSTLLQLVVLVYPLAVLVCPLVVSVCPLVVLVVHLSAFLSLICSNVKNRSENNAKMWLQNGKE